MTRWIRLALLLVALLALARWWPGGVPPGDAPPADPPSIGQDARGPVPGEARASRPGWPQFLPPEALDTLELIERGGPFPHAKDGSTFQNRERLLPGRPRGYYREYTVETPGSPDRGARRIVTGGTPPEVYYYTDDHYRSFRRIEVPQ